jgi:divalent metal cation (Fe/Co/Zn/Cd) transporter
LHNAADALTAVPLAIAFLAGRRTPTRRYTYGYGRAEDLAGIVIVIIIAASSVLAAYEAATRLAHPVVGLLITLAILAVLRQAAREICRRLMDAVGRPAGAGGARRRPS